MGAAVALAFVAGCAGDPSQPTAAPSSSTGTTVTTATPPPPATTSTTRPRPAPPATAVPVAGSTDTTPPPPLHVTGTDYVAITKSLTDYRDWLYAHHPDPALASSIYREGTSAYEQLVADLTKLKAHSQTIESVGQSFTFVVASARGSLVSLRAHEEIAADRLFDRDHRQVDEQKYSKSNDYVVVLALVENEQWRVADVTEVSLDPTVVL